MEANECRGSFRKRGSAHIKIPGTGALATVERIPPPKPRRDQDVLREAAGAKPQARDFDRQVAELQVRIVVLNGYTALGIPVTEAVG